MNKSSTRMLVSSVVLLVFAFAGAAVAQRSAFEAKNITGGGSTGSAVANAGIDRLLRSLDGNTWLVAETQYGLSYEKGYLGLRQVTANSPRNEIGNKYYWMIYPLSNIDSLWDSDIELFRPQPEQSEQARTLSASWDRVASYTKPEQKCVFMLMSKASVVAGRAGARLPGKGFYDFGNYLRIAEIRVHKDRMAEFEKFMAADFIPAAGKFLSSDYRRAGDRLPRYLRTVKIEVEMSREPLFHEFLQKYLVPAAVKTKTTVFVFHTIYGSEANYLMVFPFESEKDMAATGERVLSALWQKAYPYFEMLQIDSKFAGLIMGAHEMITTVRPDLSPGLQNKYAKWWE